MVLEIRKTTDGELDDIMSIYEGARAFMRRSGNMTQWTNGYPGRDVLLADISSGCSFVCLDGGVILGVFSLMYGEDPTYRVIHGGRWLNDRPYATVHRLAAGAHRKGVAAFCLDWCLRQCGNLRVDTHADNAPMRRLLEREGFCYCGVIYVDDGSPRVAYQKTDATE